ncbi:hypothetical protein BC628DRAFT_312002 [Trametes gibbosa]|nr:hypothetical protein BC628DRAFT_312002 [Trametes gibbosa]
MYDRIRPLPPVLSYDRLCCSASDGPSVLPSPCVQRLVVACIVPPTPLRFLYLLYRGPACLTTAIVWRMFCSWIVPMCMLFSPPLVSSSRRPSLSEMKCANGKLNWNMDSRNAQNLGDAIALAVSAYEQYPYIRYVNNHVGRSRAPAQGGAGVAA